MIVKTQAVVLQARKFRESSRIVTLYTREYGKIGVMARGVVRPKSKYGPSLQPMSYITVVIYRKEGRELQNLSVAEPVERFGVLTSSLERMTAGMAIVEIVNAVMHDEDRNEPLFDAVITALELLNREEADPSLVHAWFLIQLATQLGYAIRTDTCGICDEPLVTDGIVPYSLSVGAPLCAEHRESLAHRPLPADAFVLLCALCQADSDHLPELRPDPRAALELIDTLTLFIRYHVEGLRRLKVGSVSAKVLDTTPAASLNSDR